MSIFKYKVFHTVVEQGSLTKAADTLNLTQSGVSHAIASLEKELGVSLLTRDRNGIALTTDGEIILARIREILQSDERLRQEVAAIKGLEIGKVRIGTLTSVSSQWLPGIIKEFQYQHPAIEINLSEGDYDAIEGWIMNGTVDFGFVSLPTAKPFEVLPLVHDMMYCILPPGHPLSKRTTVFFDQIISEPFILTKWGSNDDVRRILHENQIKPQVKYEVLQEQTIIAMVKNGLGISILPEMVLSGHTKDVCLVRLEKPVFRTIGIAFNSLKNTSPAARKFVDCIKIWLREQNRLGTISTLL